MDALQAIIKRRSVRKYTDRPISDADVEELCRIALLAPTDSMSQAWSIVVVRDPDQRAALTDLMIRGGTVYFAGMRRRREGVSDEEHEAWAREYTEGAIGSTRNAPAWIIAALVPRGFMFDAAREIEHDANLTSLGMMCENLFVAARAMGMGTVPMIFQRFFDAELRELLGGVPPEVELQIVSPLGYPEEFPTKLPPALAKIRRPWRTLVHTDRWDNPLQQPE